MRWHDYRDLVQNCRTAGFITFSACIMVYLVMVFSSNLLCLDILCGERSKTSWPNQVFGNFFCARNFLIPSLLLF